MKQKVFLISCAFVGGIILPLTELSSMFKTKELPDLYFFGGMLVAGVIGIVGFFIAGAESFRTAFVSGVSAPQLLGGLVKIGSTSAQTLSMFLSIVSTDVYAQQPVDSVSVNVFVKNLEQVEIKANDTLYIINDSLKTKIPYQKTIVISHNNVHDTVRLNNVDSSDITVSKNTTNWENLLRGLFARQQDSKSNDFNVSVKEFKE
jgi:hypothetical protein